MEKKHLVDTSSDDVDTGTKKPFKKTVKEKGKRTRRVTKTRRVGIQDDVVQIKLMSSDEEYISSVGESREALPISFEHDSDSHNNPCQSNEDEESLSKSIRALKRATSIGMSRGTT